MAFSTRVCGSKSRMPSAVTSSSCARIEPSGSRISVAKGAEFSDGGLPFLLPNHRFSRNQRSGACLGIGAPSALTVPAAGVGAAWSNSTNFR